MTCIFRKYILLFDISIVDISIIDMSNKHLILKETIYYE